MNLTKALAASLSLALASSAWAETSHDIVYHSAPMQGFGTKQFADIKKRIAKIMNKYLLPAGYEFQKVQHDYERLLAGKELFDRGTLANLETAKDNNERYELLHRIREDLLPFYDDIRAVGPELIGRAADAIKKARDTATTPIETTFGNLQGYTAQYVTNEGLQLIDDLRYIDIELTFRVLCDLYMTARSDEERKRILQSVEKLARYDLNAWRRVGFGVQKVLYDATCTLSEAEKATLRPLIADMCSIFLETDLQGTTWHFDSVSLERGAVPPSPAFGEFRKSVLKLLFDLYQGAASPTEKMQMIQALNTATRFPMEGSRDHLIELVLDDTRQIVEFFTERLANEPLEIVQHLEHHFLWVYRRSREMVEGHPQGATAASAKAVVASVEAFRDRANANDQFVKFKTLVGFESVFPMEWEDQSMEIQRPRKYRADKIAEYAASVTPENADEWYDITKLCLALQSNDLATFPSLGEFLKQLAARSPHIVVDWLKRDEGLLRDFLPALLAGFAESNKPDIAAKMISDWIEQGRHLAATAHYLRFAENTAIDLVVRVGEQAIKLKDAIAAIRVIAAIVARQLTSLVERTFLPMIRMLTELDDARWVDEIWFLPSLTAFFEALSEQQAEVVLAGLLLRRRIDAHEEWVLQAIARNYPAAVWKYFKGRIDRAEGHDIEDRYEAVPYQLDELIKPLAQDAQLAVRTVRGWYASDDELFTYSGGRLLHSVFPRFTDAFGAALLNLVQTGDDTDLNFVLAVLRSYNGGTFLHEVCKALVEALPEGDERVGKVTIILESTGTVSGEFGMVHAYQRQKDEIQHWLSDTRAKVRHFAEVHLRALDRAIAAEQRRSETAYELRRRDWPEEKQ
jgi:hypothetical protein